MAERYAAGRGVRADAAESRRWFDKASEIDPNAAGTRRNAVATAETARLEAEAAEVARRAAAEAEARADAADPARPLRRRAEAGDAFATFELAKRLDDGLGVRKDSGEAVRWWKALAEMTLADSQDANRQKEAWGRYGMHLLEGTGISRNVAAAVPWLEKFADATEDEYGVTGMVGILDSGNATPEQTPVWTSRERAQRRGGGVPGAGQGVRNGGWHREEPEEGGVLVRQGFVGQRRMPQQAASPDGGTASRFYGIRSQAQECGRSAEGKSRRTLP